MPEGRAEGDAVPRGLRALRAPPLLPLLASSAGGPAPPACWGARPAPGLPQGAAPAPWHCQDGVMRASAAVKGRNMSVPQVGECDLKPTRIKRMSDSDSYTV